MHPVMSTLVPSAVFAALAGFILYESATDLVEKDVASGGALYNAALVPQYYAYALLFLIVLNVVFAIVASHRDGDAAATNGDDERFAADDTVAREATFDRWASASLFALGTIAYVVLLEPLGYLLATPVFIFGLGLISGERSWLLLLLWSLGLTLALAVIFGMGFDVVLPVGLFELEL